MTTISIFKKSFNSITSVFPSSPSFQLLSFPGQFLAMYHQLRRLVQIPEKVYWNTMIHHLYLTSVNFITFLFPISHFAPLTRHCIKNLKLVLNPTTCQHCGTLIFYPVLVNQCPGLYQYTEHFGVSNVCTLVLPPKPVMFLSIWAQS